MSPISTLLILSLGLSVLADNSAVWSRVRDDLNAEYQLLDTIAAPDYKQCLLAAGVSAAHAVQADEGAKLCRLFVCRWGWHGCRKCRNAKNSSLPHVWVRQLGDRPSCWRTFQHRVDGSVDFNQNWTQFVNGFGQGENANHWIGLETLHQMTNDSGLPVRWEFTDWNGTMNWMENEFFQVSGSETKYRVSVGDQLMDRSTVRLCSLVHAQMSGQKFTTFDQDNDGSGDNCAVAYGSAWWHKACFCISPNGPYVTPPDALSLPTKAEGICLRSETEEYPWNHWYSLKTFECLLMVDLGLDG